MRPPGLQIKEVVTANTRTIRVEGEIDHASADRVLEAFERASLTMLDAVEVANSTAERELVLDLGQVEFVDSAGLRAIIDVERRARDRALSLRIVSPPEHVRAVFCLSGVEHRLPLTASGDGPPTLEYAEHVELELAIGDGAPRQARTEVREAVADKLSEPQLEVAVLLTSELVTNAVLHPEHHDGGSVGLRISCDEGRVRVEVADSGRGFDASELTYNDETLGGRGLLVVERGAARWGTRRDGRFRVWFEFGQVH